MKLPLLLIFILLTLGSIGQIDTAMIARIKALDTTNTLQMDTTAVPNDRFTQKIKRLRQEKHGLNVETVIRLKIEEEQAKDTSKKEFYAKLLAEVTSGNTATLIDNALINLYRTSFTEKEVDDLLRFYKTSAGKKLNAEYFLLMVRSIKDAEQLMKLAAAKLN